MKAKFFLLLILLLSVSNLKAQFTYHNTVLSSAGNYIGKYVDSTTSYSTGAYAIGKQNPYAGTTSAVYRSYFEYNLSNIPANATIDTVWVYYSTGTTGGYSFKITKMTTVNPSDLQANFDAIGNSSTAHSGITYGVSDFISSDLKTYLQSVLASRKLILGALSGNETANDSYASLSLSLTVYYKVPAENLNFVARNDLNGAGGGHIGVGVGISPVPFAAPKVFTALETQTVNLLAYDTLNVNNSLWLFNENEAPLNKSEWKKDYFHVFTHMGYSQSINYVANKNDNGASFIAYLKKNCKISRNDYTEFDGTIPMGIIKHIVAQNSDLISAPTTKLVNKKYYNFAGWTDDSSAPNPRTITPYDNFTYGAFYKLANHSNNAATFSNSSQKKVAYYGWKVYESSGSIWLERNNQLMNNGRSVNNLSEGPEAKSASLDYFTSASYDEYLYVTYQQKTPNGKYKVKLAKFNIAGQLIFNVDVFTSTIDYSAIDAAPVIAVTKSPALANNKPKFLIVWKQKAEGSYQDGLYYFGGVDNGSNVTWYYLPPQKFTSTDINSANPTMSVYKYPSNIILYHIAWEQGLSHIRYRGIIDNWNGGDGGGLSEHGNLETPSSGYGFTRNTNPSITVINTHPTKYSEYDSPKLSWVASYYPQDFFAAFRDKNNSQPGTPWNNFRLYYSGYVTKRVNINRTEEDNLFAFTFSEDTYSGFINKYVKSTHLSTIQTLSSQVQDLQISNGLAGWDGMDVLAFNNSALPYNFSIPETIFMKGGMNYEGRGGAVCRNGTEFYFGINELALNGNALEFKGKNDSVNISNNFILSTYLETIPFTVGNNSTLEFNLSAGVSDSAEAVSQLSENEYVDIKIQLVDTSGTVLVTLKEIHHSKDGIIVENKINYSVNLSHLFNQNIKLRMAVEDNLEDAEYSLTKIHSSSNILSKTGSKEINLSNDLIVTEYLLEQNYPNPFNPATNINYQIPEDGFVSLKIYDVLGNEIQTLVNENKTMGKYTAAFDAGNLASGVYVYKLTSGSYISSKKMLLLK